MTWKFNSILLTQKQNNERQVKFIRTKKLMRFFSKYFGKINAHQLKKDECIENSYYIYIY